MSGQPQFASAEHSFASFDGTRIAWTELGEGRPLMLLHGLFSSAAMNWVKYGTAARLAAAGFRVIMPDHRGHGASDSPTDPARWPVDVLAMDAEALIAHLGLSDYDLGGYSLGGRTTARLLVRGARPRRAIIAGMGLSGLTTVGPRGEWFMRMIEGMGTWQRGSGEWAAETFLRQAGLNTEAMTLLLRAQVDTPEDAIAAVEVPTGVVCGAEDRDNGSAEELAALLPHGRYLEVPGNHMSAVTKPELATAILEALAA
jgi:pimeloyl-ACP methyl ester carboxylesterase